MAAGAAVEEAVVTAPVPVLRAVFMVLAAALAASQRAVH